METDTVFDVAKKQLQDFFVPKTNIIAERYRFRSRGQLSSETTAQWVSVLRQLAVTCDYGDKTDEFIRDQVVEKTFTVKLRQRLLMESDLTLTKTLHLADTVETAERETHVMQHRRPVPADVRLLQRTAGRQGGPSPSARPGPPPAAVQGRQASRPAQSRQASRPAITSAP